MKTPSPLCPDTLDRAHVLIRFSPVWAVLAMLLFHSRGLAADLPAILRPFAVPPAELGGDFGPYASLLRLSDGAPVDRVDGWPRRRREILEYWQRRLGPWPPLLTGPRLQTLESSEREHLSQRRVRIELAPGEFGEGYLLVPAGQGPFPAVLVPYYEPETSVGLGKQQLRDFGFQLARRGFVTLSIGSPGGDARKPNLAAARCQPLMFLAYVAANCHTVLSRLPEVDPERIGVVGHSYGGKWSMFAACFYEKFACGAWSDPGIVFDEARSNVNYWEPWYLGNDSAGQRQPGVITSENPRTGAYKQLVEEGHDLHEVLALMAPRPFLVSGGSEDSVSRWQALNRVTQVYELLGAPRRVFLTTRPHHDPTLESNDQLYAFFEWALKTRLGAR